MLNRSKGKGQGQISKILQRFDSHLAVLSDDNYDDDYDDDDVCGCTLTHTKIAKP